MPLAQASYKSDVPINMSREMSITIMNNFGQEIVIKAMNENIELVVPRDPNIVLPSMTSQNISLSSTLDNRTNTRQFNLHFANITLGTANISKSVHLEMWSANRTLGYMIIYKFDAIPQLSSTINRTDGWSLFCPSSKFT